MSEEEILEKVQRLLVDFNNERNNKNYSDYHKYMANANYKAIQRFIRFI